MKPKKQIIFDTISDLVADFVFYDRKEDEELSSKQLENAIKNKIITIDEIVLHFKQCLEENFNDNN